MRTAEHAINNKPIIERMLIELCLFIIIFPVGPESRKKKPEIIEIIANIHVTFLFVRKLSFISFLCLFILNNLCNYIIKIARSMPIKTKEAKKLHIIRFPKNILFPSNSDIGSILKKA